MSDDGSNYGSDDDGEPGFDPASLAEMSDKDRKKWEKNLQKWRIFLDFIFRHVSITTFKYNVFEKEELTQFMIALEKAEGLREQTKLKKGEEARISSYKVMKEATDLLSKQQYINEANRIRRFLDIAGRLKGIGMIAGGYYKALKKGKVRGIDKMKYYLDYWKGFCVRSYDFTQLPFTNADAAALNELEKKYLMWPTAVRTAINLSQQFLKKTSESTGLELLQEDIKTMMKHMHPPEFVCATNIEDMLFHKVNNESKSFSLGGAASTLLGSTTLNAVQAKKFDIPKVEDIDPAMMEPIPDTGMLLQLPEEPPKEKKGKKKGKGKGKGKKGGRSVSASSHKGGKKKKRK